MWAISTPKYSFQHALSNHDKSLLLNLHNQFTMLPELCTDSSIVWKLLYTWMYIAFACFTKCSLFVQWMIWYLLFGGSPIPFKPLLMVQSFCELVLFVVVYV